MKNSGKKLVAASEQWNKEARKAKDIERRKARKQARGKAWQIA
jgi:hypothetical protein